MARHHTFTRTVRLIKQMSQLQFMNWLSDRIILVSHFFKLRGRGVFTPSQLVQKFTRFLLAIAHHVSESFYTSIIWALTQVHKLK